MQIMRAGRPILVTGMPRSGTTWVGSVIARTPGVFYVSEPFNIGKRPCACGAQLHNWFHYETGKHESAWQRHITHVIGSPLNRYNASHLLVERKMRALKRYLKSFYATRCLLKDPIALFSAGWLATTFGMQVVVLIRHPAGVASSYKELRARLQTTSRFAPSL